MNIIQRRNCLLNVVIAGVTCIISFPVAVLLFWGQRQAITAYKVEKAVRRGMSPEEITYALGQPPGAFDRAIRTFYASGKPPMYVVTISRSGLGSLIVPQHNITLYLDQNKRVFSGIDKVVYQLDEESERLRIGD